MKRFILTPRAKQDVNDIWEYIANDNIEAADRVLNALDNAMIKLAKNPGIGHWRDDRSLTDRGAASQASAPALMPAPGWRVNPDFSSIKPTSAWGFSESKKWGAETTRDHKNRGE